MPVVVVNTFFHVSEEEVASDEITQRRRKGRAQTTGAFKHQPSCFEELKADEEAEGRSFPVTAASTESTHINDGAVSLGDGADSPLYVVPTMSSDDFESAEGAYGLPPWEDVDGVAKLKTYDPFEDACADEEMLAVTKVRTHDEFESRGEPEQVLPQKMALPFAESCPLLADQAAVSTGLMFPMGSLPLGVGQLHMLPRYAPILLGAPVPHLPEVQEKPANGAERCWQDRARDKAAAEVRFDTAAVQQTLPTPVAAGSKSVLCSYAPGGSARIRWLVDARRLSGHDTTLVSPAFSVDLPGCGLQDFKIVVHSAAAQGTKGGAGFRNAKGRGRIELKCEVHLQGESDIVLEKTEGTRLGVDLTSQDGEPWCIQSISDGLIMQWNEEHPGTNVLPGDRILEVNGVRGDPNAVRAECGRSGVLRMRLQRKKEDPAFEVSFGVGGLVQATVLPAMCGPVVHRFDEQSCCGLRDGAFDLLAAVDKSARKVAIHIEVAPAGSSV